MYSDRDLYDDYFPRSERCANCGADEGETCASVNGEPLCGPCWDEHQRIKRERKAAKEVK